MKSEKDPAATVRVTDGKAVLDDPSALGMISAVDKINCKTTLVRNHERIHHFVKRISELGLTSDQVVIVILNGMMCTVAPSPRSSCRDRRRCGRQCGTRG